MLLCLYKAISKNMPLLLEILGHMWILIICCPVCDAKKFEIKLPYLAVFLHKYLKNEESS